MLSATRPLWTRLMKEKLKKQNSNIPHFSLRFPYVAGLPYQALSSHLSSPPLCLSPLCLGPLFYGCFLLHELFLAFLERGDRKGLSEPWGWNLRGTKLKVGVEGECVCSSTLAKDMQLSPCPCVLRCCGGRGREDCRPALCL